MSSIVNTEMKTRSKIIAGITLACSLSFGLGALSGSLLDDVKTEVSTRAYRALNWHSMFGYLSTQAGDYFLGMSDGHLLTLVHLQNGVQQRPTSAEYYWGLADAMTQDQALIQQANATGTIGYTP